MGRLAASSKHNTIRGTLEGDVWKREKQSKAKGVGHAGEASLKSPDLKDVRVRHWHLGEHWSLEQLERP